MIVPDGPNIGLRINPCCFKVVDTEAPLGDDPAAVPEAGSFTICAGCGTVLIYIDSETVRRASVVEVQSLEPEQLRQLRAVVQYTRQCDGNTGRVKFGTGRTFFNS